MEFSVNQQLLNQALSKIKSSLLSPSILKIKVSKSLIIAAMHEGCSTVVKIKDFKPVKEGVVTIDFDMLHQVLKGNSEIEIKSDDNQIHFKYGRCKGSLNLLEEISFEHKLSENIIELDDQSTIIFDYLDLLTLKDIKFGQDDAPISIDIESKNKLIELSCASHSEAVLIEKQVKTKSNLSTTLSPKMLKRIKTIVGKSSYKIGLDESTLSIFFEDKAMSITFSSPLTEMSPTSTDAIKNQKSNDFNESKNTVTVNAPDLIEYFSKLKTIAEPNNAIEITISKKGMHLCYTTSKGKIEDTLPIADKYKSSDDIFLVDYDLLSNNLSKFKDKLSFYFCKNTLWVNVRSTDIKINIMVALL